MKTTVWDDGPETRPSAERHMSLIWFLKDLTQSEAQVCLISTTWLPKHSSGNPRLHGRMKERGSQCTVPRQAQLCLLSAYSVPVLSCLYECFHSTSCVVLIKKDVYCIGRGERSVLPGRVSGVSALKATSELTNSVGEEAARYLHSWNRHPGGGEQEIKLDFK